AAEKLLLSLSKTFPDNPYVSDAIISNLHNREADFKERLVDIKLDPASLIQKRFGKILNDIEENKNRPAVNPLVSRYPRGAALFKNTCQTRAEERRVGKGR